MKLAENAKLKSSLNSNSCDIGLWIQALEDEVGELPGTLRVGAVQLQSDQLRTALAVECSAWKQAYARHLNRHCADVMDELHKYFRVMQRRLDHPLRDLEDIRTYKVRVRLFLLGKIE